MLATLTGSRHRDEPRLLHQPDRHGAARRARAAGAPARRRSGSRSGWRRSRSLVIIVGYGAFPWIALTLAFSFGLYGLVKKQLGPSVDAVSGLTLESLWLAPVAAVLLIVVVEHDRARRWAERRAGTPCCSGSPASITATPLLLFAAGARRVPLTVMGMLQFVAPILQFIIGVWLLGEPMSLERWIGFGLVWARLIDPDGGLDCRGPS